MNDAILSFNDQAKRTFLLGLQEARSMGHTWFSSEHLLLGLLTVEEGVAWEALRRFDVDVEKAREQVKALIGVLPALPSDHDLPATPAASRIIRSSSEDARLLERDAIGTEHLLLAITRTESSVARTVLDQLGVDSALLRLKVFQLLGFGTAYPL